MLTILFDGIAYGMLLFILAVGLSVIDFVAQQTDDKKMVRNFGVALMLSIAYSASIGGVGTLIGTPPNALLASFLQNTYNIEITFFNWMLLGVPVVAIMLPITWRTKSGAFSLTTGTDLCAAVALRGISNLKRWARV